MSSITLDGKTFLVTGGAGSIGSVLVETLLKRYKPLSVRVFDNSDYLLAKLTRKLKDERLRCLLGNVTDRNRLDLALQDVDYVFHLAAIKDVGVTEYNPLETINTNVIGTANLIECCLKSKPQKVLNLSSDKAVEVNTLYGSTKYISEQLILWGHQVGSPEIAFANIRLGNVIESRGNVFEIWEEQRKKKQPLTITDKSMYRYFIHVQEAVNCILHAFELATGGELFVPIMDEFPIMNFLVDEDPDNLEIIGIRKGEKIHERLMTPEEEDKAERNDDLWVIH